MTGVFSVFFSSSDDLCVQSTFMMRGMGYARGENGIVITAEGLNRMNE
jgi:hypothetical protein